jgi:ubiquinone/menaquinone biosynthesis C-methylase UbiE
MSKADRREPRQMFLKRDNPYTLVVGMAGVKMGDRLLQVGCVHGGRLGAMAAKVGLSGRAAVVVPDQTSAARAEKGAANAGVLVDVLVAPATKLPVDNQTFDIVVVDDTAGLFGTMGVDPRAAAMRELARVLRPGGRVLMIGATPPSGLGALLARAPGAPPFVSSGDAAKALNASGFRSARAIGEREGLAFVEAIKPR